MLNLDVKSVSLWMGHCYIMNMNYLCNSKMDKHDTF